MVRPTTVLHDILKFTCARVQRVLGSATWRDVTRRHVTWREGWSWSSCYWLCAKWIQDTRVTCCCGVVVDLLKSSWNSQNKNPVLERRTHPQQAILTLQSAPREFNSVWANERSGVCLQQIYSSAWMSWRRPRCAVAICSTIGTSNSLSRQNKRSTWTVHGVWMCSFNLGFGFLDQTLDVFLKPSWLEAFDTLFAPQNMPQSGQSIALE